VDRPHAANVEHAPEQTLAALYALLTHDPTQLIHQLGPWRERYPQCEALWLLEGLGRRALGDLAQAQAIFEQLTAAHPQCAPGWFELGRSLGGQWARAKTALLRARALVFNQPEVHRLLGICCRHLNEVTASQNAFSDYRATAQADRELQVIQAARQAGHWERLEQWVKQRLKRSYDDPIALAQLAEIAARAERYPQAIEVLQHAIELDPGFHMARHQLAYVYLQAQRFDEAATEVAVLLQANPRHLGYRFLQAGVWASLGEYPRAKTWFQEALAEDPRHASGWLGLGHVLRTLGEYSECVHAYRQALQVDPRSGEAYFSLANLKTFAFDPADEAAMLRLVNAGLADDERVNVEFALGKWFEDQHQYPKAFAFYQSANQRRKQLIPYYAKAHSAFIDRLIGFYRAPQPPPQSLGEGGVIFIVGLPRAGSTLLEQILASHSRIEGTMELPILPRLVRDLVGEREADESPRYPAVLQSLTASDWQALGERYLNDAKRYRQTDRPWFIDKMPNNFTHIGLIRQMLPSARVIDIRRHPMASCFSNFKQHFARGQSFAYDLNDLAQYYLDYVRLMRHFDVVFAGFVQRVIYEDLVDDPEAQVRRLLAGIGAGFEAQCLQFHQNARAVRTASAQQVREPLNRKGLDQWQRFAADLGPLERALRPLLQPPAEHLGWRY